MERGMMGHFAIRGLPQGVFCAGTRPTTGGWGRRVSQLRGDNGREKCRAGQLRTRERAETAGCRSPTSPGGKLGDSVKRRKLTFFPGTNSESLPHAEGKFSPRGDSSSTNQKHPDDSVSHPRLLSPKKVGDDEEILRAESL